MLTSTPQQMEMMLERAMEMSKGDQREAKWGVRRDEVQKPNIDHKRISLHGQKLYFYWKMLEKIC